MGLFKKSSEVRLRHLFQIGAKVEEYGISFYRGLAEQSTDEKVKELCLKLAAEEERHKAWIDETLERWRHLPMDMPTPLAMERELRERGIFQKSGDSQSTDKEMLAWAIDQEERMARFYQDHFDALKSVWKQKRLEQVVREEQGHARWLRELLAG
jgi:rubrerythrin